MELDLIGPIIFYPLPLAGTDPERRHGRVVPRCGDEGEGELLHVSSPYAIDLIRVGSEATGSNADHSRPLTISYYALESRDVNNYVVQIIEKQRLLGKVTRRRAKMICHAQTRSSPPSIISRPASRQLKRTLVSW